VSDPQPDGVTIPTLVMTGGPLDGSTYPLSMTAASVVLGSSMDADVQIMLGNVEPHHAQLTFGLSGLTIADAGSATGTYVNGEKVEGDQTLQEGDRICLGPPGAKDSAKLVVRLPGGAASAAPAPPAEAPGFGGEGGPLFIDDGEQPVLSFEGDAGPDLSPPPPAPPPPPAAPPLDPAGETVAEEEILAAEEVVVGDAMAGPPLEASEVPEDDGGLFDQPLPPAADAVPPPAAPPAAVPPPPPPPPPADTREPLATPAPPPAPVAPPPIDLDTEPAPPPRPQARPGRRGRRKSRRARRGSIPVLPIAGGLLALLAIGAGGWWFFMRATPPVLTAVRPKTVEPGQAVTLAGENFASEPAGNTVMFGTHQAVVSAATETSLQVVVPEDLGDTPTVPVSVQTADGRTSAVPVSFLQNPRVTALEPDVALPGQEVVVRGDNLEGQLTVTIGDAPAEVTETSEGLVRVVVPDLGLREGQAVNLVVKAGAVSARPVELIIGRLPLLLELAPERGPVGERVVIKGRGFAAEPGGNAVTFGGAPALVLAATPTELTVVAPATRTGATPEVPVVVTSGGKASSSAMLFVTTHATASSFRPRFFAAPVPEFPGQPLAFVSTELGPVLLLGGPDKSTSTAARAADVSDKLNALVASASSRPIEIEFRGNPPSVGVAGDVDTLLAPTADDAGAYAKPWEPGARSGPRLSTRAVARHWAALLQDYFELFMYRHRPLSVLALSRRGQVFMEIYGESARRAPDGSGISSSIVYPTSATMASKLRLAALVPGTGEPNEAVAVEGRWSGNLEDPDTGSYRFEARFRLEGQKLAGSFTAWRGKIEARAPLRNISFRQGTLKFTVDLRGTALEFEGILEDTTISGTARQQGRSPAPFTLQYVE
jgi:hypothetical protein